MSIEHQKIMDFFYGSNRIIVNQNSDGNFSVLVIRGNSYSLKISCELQTSTLHEIVISMKVAHNNIVISREGFSFSVMIGNILDFVPIKYSFASFIIDEVNYVSVICDGECEIDLNNIISFISHSYKQANINDNEDSDTSIYHMIYQSIVAQNSRSIVFSFDELLDNTCSYWYDEWIRKLIIEPQLFNSLLPIEFDNIVREQILDNSQSNKIINMVHQAIEFLACLGIELTHNQLL